MTKQRAKTDIAIQPGGEFPDHFGTALGLSAIVLQYDINGPPIDASRIIDCRADHSRRTVMPVPVSDINAGFMRNTSENSQNFLLAKRGQI